MSPRTSPWLAGLLGGLATLAFLTLVRLPQQAEALVIWLGAGLAFLATLSLAAWMPARWLWTDTERLTHAYKTRHGVADGRAQSALLAISGAHERAAVLRSAAPELAESLAERSEAMADKLDAAAREIFYDPGRLPALRSIISRSELISEAMDAHRSLRQRAGGDSDQTQKSRTQLIKALDALDEAFAQSDTIAADRLLAEVEASSTTAETLLAPKRSKRGHA